ncbi:MAG: arginine--tRNA ligase [Patescibacteria group bacterium]
MYQSILKKIILKLIDTGPVFKNVKPENFTFPPMVELGDLSLPVFDLADGNPAEFAASLAEKLGSNEVWEKVEAKGPYLNFYFKAEVWAKDFIEAAGKRQQAAGQKVMIEYSQPNTHKEFHVGHLRNACLGAAIVNLYRFAGNKVIAATYVNDVGLHVAKCLWAYLKFHQGEEPASEQTRFLGKIYTEAVQKMEKDETIKSEVDEILKKLERKDKDIMKSWKKTQKWSVEDFKRIYKLLGVKFDEWYFESDILENGRKIVGDLLKKGIAKKDQGAVIVDLKKYNLDVLLILKSDGTTLYSTSDLALAYKKAKKKVDVSIYVVDNRQTLYLKQIFKTLALAGFEEKMVHIPYDFVNLPAGALSSRKGNIVSFDELFNKMMEKSMAETQKRHSDWHGKKIKEVAEKISLAAIKIGMLKYGNNKVITFDMDEALSFDGKTGPYLLYTSARINSIKEKLKTVGAADYSLLEKTEERELLKLLANNENEIERACRENDPSVLCNYLFDLAQAFNDFYQKHSIIRAEDKKLRAARFNLAQAVGKKLRQGLGLLNVEWLAKM